MWQDTRSTKKKSVALIYTKDKEAEREIRETSPFTIATNSIKYLGVTLTKEVSNLFDKNFKALKKETEEDTRKWKDLPCSWMGRIKIVKWQFYQGQSINSTQFLSKSQQNSSQTLREQ